MGLARDRTSRREWIQQGPVGKNGSREMVIGCGGRGVLIQACRQKGDGGGS